MRTLGISVTVMTCHYALAATDDSATVVVLVRVCVAVCVCVWLCVCARVCEGCALGFATALMPGALRHLQDVSTPRGYIKGFVPSQYLTGVASEGTSASLGLGLSTPSASRHQTLSDGAAKLMDEFNAALATPHAQPATTVQASPMRDTTPVGAMTPPPAAAFRAQGQPPMAQHHARASPHQAAPPPQPPYYSPAAGIGAPGLPVRPAGSPVYAGVGNGTGTQPFQPSAVGSSFADDMDLFEERIPSVDDHTLPEVAVPPPRSMLAQMYAAKFGTGAAVAAGAGHDAASSKGGDESWRQQALEALQGPVATVGVDSETSRPLGRLPTLEEFKVLRRMRHASVEGLPPGDMGKYMPRNVADAARARQPSSYARPTKSPAWVGSSSSLAARLASVAARHSNERVVQEMAAQEEQRAAEASAARAVAAIVSGGSGASATGAGGGVSAVAGDSVAEAELSARVQRLRLRTRARSQGGPVEGVAKPKVALDTARKQAVSALSGEDVESLVERIRNRAAAIRSGDASAAAVSLL